MSRENTPLVKQEAIKGYGANLVHSGNTMEEREAKAEEVLAMTGGTLVHPYNDVDVRASSRLRTIAAHNRIGTQLATLLLVPFGCWSRR